MLKKGGNAIHLFTKTYSLSDGEVKVDRETTLDFDNKSGEFVKKEFGKVIEKKTINKKDFNKFVEKNFANAYVEDEVLNQAASILGLIVDSLDHSFKQSSSKKTGKLDLLLEEGSSDSDKKVKIPLPLSSKPITRREICDEFIKFLGIEKETADKIREAYSQKRDMLSQCKMSKKKCQDELSLLERLYKEYNDPKNGCIIIE